MSEHDFVVAMDCDLGEELKQRKHTFCISGDSLLFDRHDFDIIDEEDALRKQGVTDRDKIGELLWKKKAYVAPDGRLYLPKHSLRAALTAAVVNLKCRFILPISTSPFKDGSCFSSLSIDGKTIDDLQLFKSLPAKRRGMLLDKRPLFRPMISGWTGRFNVVTFHPGLTEEVLKIIVAHAGRFVGIGAWRAESGGEFGRFSVVSSTCEAAE